MLIRKMDSAIERFIKKKTGPIIDDGEEDLEIPSESEDKDYDDVPVE